MLEVQQQARVDVALQVGVLNETVSVVADASVLDATTSSVGKVVDNARIQSLPLNTRNIYSLIYLTPGVQGTHRQLAQSGRAIRSTASAAG